MGVLQKESIDIADDASESETPDSESRNIARVQEWFDNDEESGPAPDILEVIKARMNEARKFKTPRAFKAFTNLAAVLQYIKLRERYRKNPHCKRPCMSASLAVARRCGKADGTYFAWQIRLNEHHLVNYGRLPLSKKGNLHGQATLLDNESVLLGVQKYLAAQALGTISTKSFCQEINNVISPALGFVGKEAAISERTARRWLHKLGYSCVEVKKGLYHDGHERPDVVESRQKFLDTMASYERSVIFCICDLALCTTTYLYLRKVYVYIR